MAACRTPPKSGRDRAYCLKRNSFTRVSFAMFSAFPFHSSWTYPSITLFRKTSMPMSLDLPASTCFRKVSASPSSVGGWDVPSSIASSTGSVLELVYWTSGFNIGSSVSISMSSKRGSLSMTGRPSILGSCGSLIRF